MEIIIYIVISMTELSWKVLHWCSPHHRKGNTLTGWMSLLSGQAAVLLSPKSRGVSHWKIIWAPSIFWLYSSFRLTQYDLQVLSFASVFGSPGGSPWWSPNWPWVWIINSGFTCLRSWFENTLLHFMKLIFLVYTHTKTVHIVKGFFLSLSCQARQLNNECGQ